MSNLTLVQSIAVATVIKKADELKKELTPGPHQVDMVVRIKGTINKGESTEGVIAQRAEPWTLLAVALSKLNGVTMESIAREALTAKEEEVEAIKEKAAEAITVIKGKVIGPISGKTTTNLSVELVG